MPDLPATPHPGVRALRGATVLLVLLLWLVAVARPAAAQEIVVGPDGLSADEVTIEVGEPLDIVNQTDGPVRIADDAGTWESGLLAPGEGFSITFDEPATMAFSSEDGSLTGTITVIEAATESTTETATESATEAATEAADVPPDGPLASTGAPVSRIAGVGLLALLVGVALVVLARRGSSGRAR